MNDPEAGDQLQLVDAGWSQRGAEKMVHALMTRTRSVGHAASRRS